MHLRQVVLQGIVREPIHQLLADMGQKFLGVVQICTTVDTLHEGESSFRKVAANLACLFYLRYHCKKYRGPGWTIRPSFLYKFLAITVLVLTDAELYPAWLGGFTRE